MQATTAVKINRALARKVLGAVDAGLVAGVGKPVPGQMCVEAAVNYAMGHKHGDSPSCVGAAVRAFKIRLNDAKWPTNKDRTEGMRKLAIAQLGSDQIDQNAFCEYVVVETVKRILPIALRAAASVIQAHKNALEEVATACEAVVDISSARAAVRAVRAANEKARAARASATAANAAAYAAVAIAYAAAYAAVADAIYTAVADATYAAVVIADATAYVAVATADATTHTESKLKKRLEVLQLCAQIGLEALKKLKSPGTEWLDLCE